MPNCFRAYYRSDFGSFCCSYVPYLRVSHGSKSRDVGVSATRGLAAHLHAGRHAPSLSQALLASAVYAVLQPLPCVTLAPWHCPTLPHAPTPALPLKSHEKPPNRVTLVTLAGVSLWRRIRYGRRFRYKLEHLRELWSDSGASGPLNFDVFVEPRRLHPGSSETNESEIDGKENHRLH